MACAQFVAQHPNTPDVYHFIVFAAHNNLGRHVVQSPTESCPLVGLPCVDGPTEIGQFHNVVDEHDVLGFEVTVDYSPLVEMQQSVDGLPDVVGGLSLGEKSFLAEDIEQRGLPNFQDQI